MNIPPRQRGAAALAVTLLLLFTLTLVVGIWLVVIGVFEVVASFGIRKAGNTVRDRIEAAV